MEAKCIRGERNRSRLRSYLLRCLWCVCGWSLWLLLGFNNVALDIGTKKPAQCFLWHQDLLRATASELSGVSIMDKALDVGDRVGSKAKDVPRDHHTVSYASLREGRLSKESDASGLSPNYPGGAITAGLASFCP